MNSNTSPLKDECVDPMCACRGGPCAECPVGDAAARNVEVRSLRSQDKPVAWVPRAHSDSETTIAGEYRWLEIQEKPFEMSDPLVWECATLYASPPSQPIASDVVAAPDHEGLETVGMFSVSKRGELVFHSGVTDAQYLTSTLNSGVTGGPYTTKIAYASASVAAPDAKDAARYRALRQNTGSEYDLSSGPGTPKTILLRLNAEGCERYLESGAPDFPGTLDAVLDDEIRIQRGAAVAATSPDVLSRQSPVEADTLSSEATKGPWRVGADLQAIHPNYRDDKGNDTPDNYHRNGFAKVIVKGKNPDDLRLIVKAVNAYRAASPSDTSQGVSEPGPCGCRLGECESKADAVCRMSEEIKNEGAQ